MLKITVTETGGREVALGLKRFGDEIQDLRPVWPRIQELFYGFEREAFDSEGASSAGGRWAALSERYARWKARRYSGAKILERTGDLRASLTGPGTGSTVYSEPLWMQISTEVEYAKYHQFGARVMPARKPVSLRADQVAAFGQAVHRYIARDVMKSWSGQIAAESSRRAAA